MLRKPYLQLCLTLLALAAAGMPLNYAWGLEPQAAQKYCDEVKQAAQAAQMKYLQIYQPRTNPGKSFDDATLPCLDFITTFNSSFPSLLDDAVLSQISKRLLQRTCQAARDQFDKAINEAKQSISGVPIPIPEINQSKAFYSPSDSFANTAMPVILDSADKPNKRPAAGKTIDRVINMLK